MQVVCKETLQECLFTGIIKIETIQRLTAKKKTKTANSKMKYEIYLYVLSRDQKDRPICP